MNETHNVDIAIPSVRLV